MFWRNSGGYQLPPARFRKVDVCRPAEVCPLRKKFPKPCSDFRSHFVTTGSDRRPDRSLNVRRITIELRLHPLERPHRDFFRGPSPSRVDRRDDPPLAVDKKNRNAIRCANPQQSSPMIGDQSITLSDTPAVSVGNNRNVGMDLFQGR